VAFANTLFGRVFLCARNCPAGAALHVFPKRAISAAIVDLPPDLVLFKQDYQAGGGACLTNRRYAKGRRLTCCLPLALAAPVAILPG